MKDEEANLQLLNLAITKVMKDGAIELANNSLAKAEAKGAQLDFLNSYAIRIQNDINDKVAPLRKTEREAYAYIQVLKESLRVSIENYRKEVAKA